MLLAAQIRAMGTAPKFLAIFDCCWRDSVKPLQFCCKSLPVSCPIDERQLIFLNKLQHTDNPILRTLFLLPTMKYEILGLAAKYGLMVCRVTCLL